MTSFTSKIKNKHALAIIMVFLYLSMSLPAIFSAGVVWDETRHISNAKARLYSVYSIATGKPQLDMCSIDKLPEDPEDEDRCWAGRPRLSISVAGITWGAAMALSGMSLDVVSSVAAHRISTLIFTSLCIFFLVLFAFETYGTKAALLSSAALIFIPRFFIHSLYTTLDAPIASMMLIASYFIWKGTKSRKYAIASGIVFGLALATKVTAFLLPLAIVPWLLICYRDRILKRIKSLAAGRIEPTPAVFLLASLIIISPVVFLIIWPWLWNDTLPRLLGYVGLNAAHSVSMNVATFYLGESYIEVPWHYSWVMLLATVPATILFFSILGGIRTLKEGLSMENRASLLLLFGFLLLPLVFTSPLATPHDAMRMYLPTFPFLAMLAGIGGSTLLEFIRGRRASILALFAVLLMISVPGAIAISQGTHAAANYYSLVVGGTEGAYERGFEMDYYGESYNDVVLWLNENAPNGSSIFTHAAWNIMETYKYGDIGQIAYRIGQGKHSLDSVASGLGTFTFEQAGLLSNDIKLAENEEDSDYYIILNRRSLVERSEKIGKYLKNCSPIYTIYSGGVPQAFVYKTGCA